MSGSGMVGGERRSTSGARSPRSSENRRHVAASPAEPGSPLPMGRAMREATEQLAALIGKQPESVSAVKRTEDGWQADIEVLEIPRVPDTTSVMASYRVRLDETGRLTEYERRQRYARGRIER
ncbi:gas vesicle protein [Streptomyces lushanensis]|uniref:gas vesicle protein GvpO n=1 Tax=Streptomyces lushanensis TaxID=1434255 RepID=UPI001FE00230|nr:gas vesicle protein [Streptomyces lushanensis]